MTRRVSLLTKVFLIHAGVLCLAALAVPSAIDVLLTRRAAFYEHKVLTDRATLVAKALSVGPDGRVRLASAPHVHTGEDDEFSFVVTDDAGTVLISSSQLAAGLLALLARTPAVSFEQIETSAGHYDTISLPTSVDGHQLWVHLGWNTSQDDVIFDDVLRNFLCNALALTVPVLLLLLLLDMAVVRHFFRPVQRISQRIHELSTTGMPARLPAGDLPAELLPLAEAFNAALDKVERGAQLVRNFTADAAHELRTPLAVLDARLQTFLEPGERRDQLLADTRRMARIVSQLLDIARLEHMDSTTEVTDLAAVCRDVVSAMAPEVIAHGQSLGLTAPETPVAIPVVAREQDVWHILRNLIENAIHHTPAGTTIDVVLEADGRLTVRDDGPGIPAEFQPHVFQRFWRRRRDSGSGAGLGLAIVQRVVQANGGTIELRSAERRGTSFVVRLPSSPRIA